jgi:predicted HTH domain antitoxin
VSCFIPQDRGPVADCTKQQVSAMSIQVTIELPEDVLPILRTSPDAFVAEMRLAAAIKWYEQGRVSQGKAAELAGLSRQAFIDALGRYDVSPIQTTPEQLEREFLADDG